MKTLILTAACVAFAGAVSAAPPHALKAAKATALVCPVTGEKISSAKSAYNHETYKGKTYYFCCPDCKPTFDKNPAKVIANAAHGKYNVM